MMKDRFDLFFHSQSPFRSGCKKRDLPPQKPPIPYARKNAVANGAEKSGKTEKKAYHAFFSVCGRAVSRLRLQPQVRRCFTFHV
jgi:hypothetical protein